MTTKYSRACVICNCQDKIKQCACCKSVYYCSIEHQKMDWSKHKLTCIKGGFSSSHKKPTPTVDIVGSTRTDNALNDSNITKSDNDTTNTTSSGNDATLETNISQMEASNNVMLSLEVEAEIKHILDFSTVILPSDSESDIPQSQTEQCKDIFKDLIKSETNFSGPSDNTEASENDVDDSFAIESVSGRELTDMRYEQLFDNNDEITAFDSRPLNNLTFFKPESYQHKDLAEFICRGLIKSGYCVVDEVFEKTIIDGILAEIKSLKDKNELKEGQLGGGPSSGNDAKKVIDANIRRDVIKWIDGNEGLAYTAQVLGTMDSIISFFNNYLKNDFINGRTKAMVSCYPGNGTYYRRHVDNPSKDGRRITCILYLNKNWETQKDGGLLRIFPLNQENPIDIPPIANRMLYFWSDRRNPHEVQPSFRERFAMTVWYFDSEEREEARIEELRQETERISGQITELEEKRRQLEQLTQDQVLENKAVEAVKSLSEQELEAVSFLIHNHPDPKQVMSSMGISDTVQKALIKYLTTGRP
ncbi:unnamed protein product [Lymnaea stagnalis]|uniref:hypoxia-inducible factor-proline dioxygenase n=1 Tax=Lymnaea stagnalis TaxID=6523 RepID=A0AAV2H2J1_LYMST